MAIRIVERFEVIDIQHQQSQRHSLPRRPVQFALQRNLHKVAIEQARHAVPYRLTLQLRPQIQTRNRHRRQLNHLLHHSHPAICKIRNLVRRASEIHKAQRISLRR